ncbi:MAG TPA: hypothetical protein PKA35_07905 [Paracoccus solventivorans]|uniref:hypothetical protein n=1 Tax=Paracoccus solventivorans TaxID=53463 RepID=UPI002C841C12|nr:hypothetical protein [Paracoccus solventivorans]HMM09027.1 hypothetical protein [Paracoccus solventivorans]
MIKLIFNMLKTSSKAPVKATSRAKGPKVKTGPTRDEVRSRNQDGRWRAKRSDAGKPRASK